MQRTIKNNYTSTANSQISRSLGRSVAQSRLQNFGSLLSPVESAGGLVEEEQPGPHQDLQSNAHSPLLPTANPSQVPVPDHRVCTVLQAHLDDRTLDKRPLLLPRHLVGQPEPGGVRDCLSNSQGPDQVVVLRHIGLKVSQKDDSRTNQYTRTLLDFIIHWYVDIMWWWLETLTRNTRRSKNILAM